MGVNWPFTKKPQASGLGSSVIFDSCSLLFCLQSVLDTAVGKSSALSATRFSLRMSREGSVGKSRCGADETDDATCSESSSSQCCGQGDGSCHSNTKKGYFSIFVLTFNCQGPTFMALLTFSKK